VRFIVQRVQTSSECRNCTIESTWSAYFDIGKVATSDSKVSSQGALTGSHTRLRSILGVCAIGPMIAAHLRKRRLKPHTTWHLNEVYLKIDGRMVYLWRAVDAEGEVLDVLVQSKRKHASS
jgi:DDE domain